jgi:hypothetical protein
MCVHIKVVFEMILSLTILNLSLYDVKYKYIFYIKYVLGLGFFILKIIFKKFTIFVHVHVRYVFTFKLIKKKTRHYMEDE